MAGFLRRIFGGSSGDNHLFELFRQHGECTALAAKLLGEMVSNMELENGMYPQRIKECEHDGDNFARKVHKYLRTTFITPIDREDIHRLINKLDDTLDTINRIAWRLRLYRIKAVPQGVKSAAEKICQMTKLLQEMLVGLSALSAEEMSQKAVAVKDLEEKIDNLRDKLITWIVEEETLGDKEFVMWHRIFDLLNEAANRGQSVADVLASIADKR